MTSSIDLEKPAIGSIGVMLDDASQAPKLYRLINTGGEGCGFFEALDDGSRLFQAYSLFWPLLDSLP